MSGRWETGRHDTHDILVPGGCCLGQSGALRTWRGGSAEVWARGWPECRKCTLAQWSSCRGCLPVPSTCVEGSGSKGFLSISEGPGLSPCLGVGALSPSLQVSPEGGQGHCPLPCRSPLGVLFFVFLFAPCIPNDHRALLLLFIIFEFSGLTLVIKCILLTVVVIAFSC